MPDRERQIADVLSIGHTTSMRGEGRSLRDAIARSGYRKVKPALQWQDLLPYIKQQPELVEQWLMYSEDKRTGGGWYVTRDAVVGRLAPTRTSETFDSIEQAVAVFVIRELDFWAELSSPIPRAQQTRTE